MAEPTVSVVVPVCNGGKFLSACLESVFAQRHRPLEVIVVDDGSTDGSPGIARRFASVRVIQQPHTGVAAARNTGIEAASGEFIGFVDQDDLWTADKLAVQLPLMNARRELAFSLAHLRVFLEAGVPRPSWLQPEALDRPLPGFVTGTLLARSEIFSSFGRFDPTCGDASDAEWLLRARDESLPFEVLAEVLLEKRTHADNTSGQIEHCHRMMLEAVRRSVVRRRAAARTRP